VANAEVIIIGGGVVGCSIAYHLAKNRCRDVIVVERNTIGSGATDKCTGGIRQQFSSDINIKLSIESVNFFEHFQEETGYPADFRQNGYLILATSEDELEAFRNNVALQQSLGADVCILSPQQAGEIVPSMNTEDVLGATYCPTDGYADPYSVVQGFASAARKCGARIYEDTEAVAIDAKGSRINGVLTSAGKFESPVLVNAAGPHAAEVARMAGLDIPVRPLRRHIFVAATVEEVSKNAPLVIDFHNGLWFRREGPSLIFGMRNPDELEGFDTSIDWGFFTNSLAKAACHRLPFLSDVGILRAQAGLHSDTPDYNAILGEVPGIEGLYLACGFSGHGFMHSPATGRLMAELIMNGKTDLDLSLLSLDRFKAGVLQETYFI